ncbi:hypothetical protein [Micromonospora sp. NPDC049497]|uniref:hypothetical protein n=1 Tax=Micromonospora sp. NPDC049497 TaxID=3364273 RepID=UPI00379A95E4
MAAQVRHLIAGQVGMVARQSRLVLTHVPQRYGDRPASMTKAAAEFDSVIVVAQDLMRVAVPARIPSGE